MELENTVNLWGKTIPFNDDENNFVPVIAEYTAGSKGAVIIFPGGGYASKTDYEGPVIAKWLNSIGITAFVVDYRVAPYKHPAEISDAQRAVRFVRANAKKYGIDENKIAVMGFSAGGHLAASVSVHYDKVFYEPTDKTDKVSARPDASILCYSVIDMYEYRHDGSRMNLLGYRVLEREKELMSVQLHVTEDTPTAFLWHTTGDRAVPEENTLLYAAALAGCNVPFEVHIYPCGDHGLGLAHQEPYVAQWSSALEKWLLFNNWK